MCPRCTGYACIVCWHGSVDLCNSCLLKDPASAAPPIPWEVAHLGVVTRFFETLKTAVYPTRTAPAFAEGPIRPALVFFLLTFVPLALAQGVVPYTHTLQFGPGFGLTVAAGATPFGIVLDVLRAMALSLGLGLLQLAALALPYVTLARAYGVTQYKNAGIRLVLYRGFLLALTLKSVLVYLALWVTPSGYAARAVEVVVYVELVPIALLFFAMRATARLAHGVGPFASLAVVLTPLVLLSAVYAFAERLVAPWLPGAPP